MKNRFPVLLILISVFTTTSFLAQAQDINYTDNNGLRQGKWADYYDNGKLRYKGQFEDGEGVGVFEYYDEKGVLKAKNTFEKNNRVYNQTYSSKGKLIASGYYVDQKRDGEWRFYSEKDGSLILVEPYQEGHIHGVSRGYKTEKMMVEETEYVNGVKNGIFNTYYDNGRPLSKGFYKDGNLSGHFVTYYPNGNIQYQGEYYYGVRMGEWKTFDIDGNLVSTDNHNIQNYRDPSLQDLIPDE